MQHRIGVVSELTKMVEYARNHSLDNLELEARIGTFCKSTFKPGFPFSEYAVVEALLEALRSNSALQCRKFFTLKCNYENDVRMISDENASTFEKMNFQTKTRIRTTDFECLLRGSLGLRLSLSQEKVKAVGAEELHKYIPTSVVLRNRQEFREVVSVYHGSELALSIEVFFHVTKVSPPQRNKFDGSQVVCSFHVEVELGAIESTGVLPFSEENTWIASVLFERCNFCMGSNRQSFIQPSSYLFYRESGAELGL